MFDFNLQTPRLAKKTANEIPISVVKAKVNPVDHVVWLEWALYLGLSSNPYGIMRI